MGDGVNIAARLQGVAKPGTICLSEQAYWQVKGRLDLAVTDLGKKPPKNIAEPVHAYSVEVGKPAQAKPPSRALPEIDVLARPIGRRARGAAPSGRGRRVVARQCEPARRHRCDCARRARAAFDCRAALRQSLWRSGQDYLVDALTDELTTSFARIRGAFVIARNTAMTFKGKPVDAKAIGKDLGVRYILEGSVQPSGAQMRVNAQLIDAETGAHLWAEQFDTPRADLLQAQDAIVAHLTRAIGLRLSDAEAARLKRSPAAIRCRGLGASMPSGL